MVAVAGVKRCSERRPIMLLFSRQRVADRELWGLPRYRPVNALITILIGFQTLSDIIRTQQGCIKVDKTFV